MATTTAYKVFTHALCSPVQGGDPVWDGSLPFDLPKVNVDRSDLECSYGWNACRELATALEIAHFWRDGWPARAFVVRTTGRVVERDTKLRAATWTIERAVTDDELDAAILTLSERWFGDLAEAMAARQRAWFRALGRPQREAAAVEAGLRAAMAARGLDWTLRQYESEATAWDAWAARDSCAVWDARDSCAVWDARDSWAAWAARDSWDARAARAAWAARDSWAAWAARDSWDARDSWAAWAAWDASNALMVAYSALQGWTKADPDLLTTGLIDAYSNGLAIVLPVGPKELGWAMVEARNG